MEDVHFADFIIADITAGLKNCIFAEIAPRTFYPLYGIYLYVFFVKRLLVYAKLTHPM